MKTLFPAGRNRCVPLPPEKRFLINNTTPDPVTTRAAAENWHPLKRMGTTEEVAYAALYLASKESGFVTGSSLMIDGGRSIVYHD